MNEPPPPAELYWGREESAPELFHIHNKDGAALCGAAGCIRCGIKLFPGLMVKPTANDCRWCIREFNDALLIAPRPPQ